MKSRTKFEIDDKTIERIFLNAEISDIQSVQPLGKGEFNAVYQVKTPSKDYVLKVAPSSDTEVLPYEKNMMKAEVFWYAELRENTIINVPKVYVYDDSKRIIGAEYFIMDKIEGTPQFKQKMTKKEKANVTPTIAKMTASMHNVTNDKYGYVQQTLYDDWYQALRSMTVSLLDSLKAKGHRSYQGEKLLKYIDKNKEILQKAECSMVNYDIWDMNMLVNRINGELVYYWIDPERCFWGDRAADFICLQVSKPYLKDKKIAINAYNQVSRIPIEINKEINIRYGIMMAYMGLLLETEKYFRYTVLHAGWWRNIFIGKFYYYRAGFKTLKSERLI